MALSWRASRQLKIIGVIVFIIGILLFIFVIDATSVVPTCSDGKKNGSELGIDCGGACVNYCKATLKTPSIVWARSFKTSDTVVNSVAYIENQNTNAISSEIKYEFRLYDTDRRFIAERVGYTYIGGNGPSAIFEGGIVIGNREVKYTDFNFLSEPVWSLPNDMYKDVKLLSKDGVVVDAEKKPRLTGTVSNQSQFFHVFNIDVIGIVYDVSDNAIGVSKTFIDSLNQGEQKDITFTWREPFLGLPTKTEIISRFNPFTISE